MAGPEITLFARLEGVEQVTSGFRDMGEASSNMSAKMEVNSRRLAMTSASLIMNSVQLVDAWQRISSAGLRVEMAQERYTEAVRKSGAGSLDAKRALEDLNRAQQEGARGALALGMNFLQLGSQIALLNAAYGGLITQKIASIALSAKEALADFAAATAKAAHTLATWALVAAQKARALASAIAAAIETYGLAVPIIAAAAAAVTVAVAAALSRIPSREFGGPIERGGIYRLHAGEFVLPRGGAGTVVNITIKEPVFRNRSDMNYLVDRLKRLGAA